MANGIGVACAIRYLVNVRGLNLEDVMVFHESLFVPLLLQGRDNDMEGEGEF